MNDHTVERWLPVVGFEGAYEVSNFGNVRSLTRKVWSGTFYVTARGRTLAQFPNRWRMQLGLSRDGKTYPKLVHALVMEAFVGPRPEGAEICHNDGDYTNNHLLNLRYDNHRANMLDAVEHNTHPWSRRGSCKNGHALTDENIYRQGKKPNTRVCRTCATLRMREWRAKRQQTA